MSELATSPERQQQATDYPLHHIYPVCCMPGDRPAQPGDVALCGYERKTPSPGKEDAETDPRICVVCAEMGLGRPI